MQFLKNVALLGAAVITAVQAAPLPQNVVTQVQNVQVTATSIVTAGAPTVNAEAASTGSPQMVQESPDGVPFLPGPGAAGSSSAIQESSSAQSAAAPTYTSTSAAATHATSSSSAAAQTTAAPTATTAAVHTSQQTSAAQSSHITSSQTSQPQQSLSAVLSSAASQVTSAAASAGGAVNSFLPSGWGTYGGYTKVVSAAAGSATVQNNCPTAINVTPVFGATVGKTQTIQPGKSFTQGITSKDVGTNLKVGYPSDAGNIVQLEYTVMSSGELNYDVSLQNGNPFMKAGHAMEMSSPATTALNTCLPIDCTPGESTCTGAYNTYSQNAQSGTTNQPSLTCAKGTGFVYTACTSNSS